MGLLDDKTRGVFKPKAQPAKQKINAQWVGGSLLSDGKEVMKAPSLLDSAGLINQFMPVTGDIQSGLLAINDAKKGNYGSAALNAVGLLPFLPSLHTVYHGSPHTFDKFDMSKIGTGEGAQAYGHGLYFAESPDVAKSYMNPVVTQKLTDKEIEELVNLKIKSRKNVESLSNEEISKMNDLWTKHSNYEDSIKNYKQPSLYKVEIPDEAIPKMLDWDKPLSQQPEVMKKLLQNDSDWNSYAQQLDPKSRAIAEDMVLGKKPKLWDDSTNYWNALYKKYPNLDHNTIHDVADKFNPKTDDADWLMQIMNGGGAVGSGIRGGGGADFYNSLGGGEVASSQLKALGIPGIRYLDGGSRGAGQGTYNYVIFDDSLPKILERNGQPLRGIK